MFRSPLFLCVSFIYLYTILIGTRIINAYLIWLNVRLRDHKDRIKRCEDCDGLYRKSITQAYHFISNYYIRIFLSDTFGKLFFNASAGDTGWMGASFSDALFTATSAVCVTGLVVHDTATYWSFFGQTIIIC